jgi:hypothetical protein
MREPEPHQLSRATEAARTSVRHADAPELLRRYYDPTNGYAGSTFLNLEPNDPRDLTATDLYALSLLDVRATPLAGRRLLQPGDHRERVLTALASPDLPASANLLTATPATFDAAETLYLAVRDALGQKPWVTASKLCARKRPHFFPVRDSVVTQLVLGLGQYYLVDWKVYRHLLSDQELMAELGAVTARASELSDRPDGIADPPLRVLDVLLWMTAPADLRRRRGRA